MLSDATSAVMSDATSMSMSLMVELVALFVTIFVTFIFVIDIGLGLDKVDFGPFCDGLETS